MEQQTKTVLEAFVAVLVSIAEETAELMEARSDLDRKYVAGNRDKAANLRESARRVQSMLASV